MKHIVFYLSLLVAISGQIWAQQISEVKAVSQKDSVQLSFQLIDPVPERWFQVKAYAVTNSDTILLSSISGTGIGDSIQAGSYSFTWDSRKDLGRYKGGYLSSYVLFHISISNLLRKMGFH